MNREIQYGDRRIKLENLQYIDLQKLSIEWKEKFGNGDNRLLKVYIDLETQKYYITVFAASSLGILAYNEASRRSVMGQDLYEISQTMLRELKLIFNDRIVYEYLTYKNISKNNNFIGGNLEITNKEHLDMIKKHIIEEQNNLDEYADNIESQKKM